MADTTIDIRQLPNTTIDYVVRGQGYFPVIVPLGGQEVLVMLRGGAGHMGIKGRLDVVRSSDGGQTWEPPLTVANSERDDRNPAFGVARDGTLILAYHWQGCYDEEGAWVPEMKRVDTRIVYSRDRGRTWIDDALLDFTPLNGASPFGKIRCDAEGTLYMPIYGGPVLPGLEGFVQLGSATGPTYLLRSRDHGRTWGDPILVALGLNEADLLLLPEGDWLFAGRSEEGGALHTCRSSDQGRTWGDLQQVTEDREHPPDLTLLSNGYVLLCFGRRNPPYGVQGLISRDQGRSWDTRRLVFADDLPGRDIGYPSTVRLDNGRMITVFYSAGTSEQPHVFDGALNVFCRVVCYDEEALLAAID